MTSENRVAIASYSVQCPGAYARENRTRKSGSSEIKDKDIGASITVYSDGHRDIGCPYLMPLKGRIGTDKCLYLTPFPPNFVNCSHLFPQTSEPPIPV